MSLLTSLKPPYPFPPVGTIKINQFAPWLAITCISGTVCTKGNYRENLTSVLNCSGICGYLRMFK